MEFRAALQLRGPAQVYKSRFPLIFPSWMSSPIILIISFDNPRHTTLLNAGISVCANQKLNTSFGPVISSFGVNPLKKLVIPSFFIILPTIRNPLSGFSKLRFCIRVLMTSKGAESISEAEAPAMDATKFCIQDAVL